MVPQVEDDLIDKNVGDKTNGKGVVFMFYLHYKNDWMSWHNRTPENCILLQSKRSMISV